MSKEEVKTMAASFEVDDDPDEKVQLSKKKVTFDFFLDRERQGSAQGSALILLSSHTKMSKKLDMPTMVRCHQISVLSPMHDMVGWTTFMPF